MQKFCLVCGAQLKPDARFCTGCGVAISAAPVETAQDVVPEAEADSSPAWDDEGYRPQRSLGVRIAVVAFVVAALAVAGYVGWTIWGNHRAADSAVLASGAASTANVDPGQVREMYVIADANVRGRPTSLGSKTVSKLVRGTKASGVMVIGADNETSWFKLTDGNGFVWAVNLSYVEPPVLSRILNAEWSPSMNGIEIRAQADPNSAILDSANIGHKYFVSGITQNNFAEVKLDKGGVGYVLANMVNLAQGPAQSCEANLMQTRGYTLDQASAQCAAASTAEAADGAAGAARDAASDAARKY